MTTFQDPQPQSRRAVRQSERGEAAEPTVGFTQFPPAATPAAPQFTEPPAQPTGRRSSGAPVSQTPPALVEPTSAPAVQPQDALPPTQVMPKVEQPAYRVRDFSPAGRRAAPVEPTASVPAAAAPAWTPAPVAPPIAEIPVEIAAPIAHNFVAPAAPVVEPEAGIPVERTLTRRELRALQQAEGAATESTDLNDFFSRTTEVDAPAVAPVAEAPSFAAPDVAAVVAPSDEPQAWPFAGLFPDPSAAVVAEEPIVPVVDAVVDPLVAPVVPQPVAPPVVDFVPPVAPPVADFVAPPVAPVEPAPQRVFEDAPTSQWTAPVGHWSTQAGLDDENQPYESTINRTVGSGTVTTNALVLGAIPEGSDIRGPLTGTGEIMLTGSIDLPHAYTSTGATARVEHSSIDALFDMHDAEVVTTDSQPVRAISAVSTHNSGQGVTHTQKPKGTKALTALVISAASMAVVVVGLLVAVFALNIF